MKKKENKDIMKIITFRVECVSGTYLSNECIRIIEFQEDASLWDLNDAIQDAVDFGRDHPYEFYAGRNARHRKKWFTYKEEWDDKEEDFCNTKLKDIYPLGNMKLYYWFDFGDRWIFEIRKLRKIKEAEIGIEYPCVIESIGPNPDQYPKFEE